MLRLALRKDFLLPIISFESVDSVNSIKSVTIHNFTLLLDNEGQTNSVISLGAKNLVFECSQLLSVGLGNEAACSEDFFFFKAAKQLILINQMKSRT